jgi:transaldolase
MSTTEQNRTHLLRDAGQSLWLDNITRAMLDDGTLQGYIDDFAITGLTSNPTIFEKAIAETDHYDETVHASHAASSEDVFVELAIEDLRRAADLFAPAHKASHGVDGWVSLEVSPLLADDAAGSIRAARELHARAQRKNLFVKIPGTPAGTHAIEESIFAGVPINVTLLFSPAQYVAAAEAWMRGIERRIKAGLDPHVPSVASLFVSRWDVAVNDRLPAELRNRIGIAVAMRTYRTCCELLDLPRLQALLFAGARPQRLLWASTGTKDPGASDTLYVEALVAPDTIDTMPDKTLKAFADHGRIDRPLPRDGGDCDRVLRELARAGVDAEKVAADLQREGAQAFVKSWNALLHGIDDKRGEHWPRLARAR